MSEIEGKSDKYIAALAVRMNSIDILKLGLNSLFKSNAIADYRDIISALVLYYDAAKRIGENPDRIFLDHAQYADDDVKRHLTKFVSRTPEQKEISVGGYVIAHDPEFSYKFKD